MAPYHDPVADAQPTHVSKDWPAVKDHSRDYHQFAYVYPVISRRSGGLSLGVNLNPDKRCNFDCVYCEVDRTTPSRTSQLDSGQVRRELDAMIEYVQAGRLAEEPKFRSLPSPVAREIKDIAFSGDGEPTMIPNFADYARLAADARRRYGLDATKLVLITDAAGLDKREVREGLQVLDANNGEVWGKLDAGTETYYREVNRTRVGFARILKNLTLTARTRPIVIQSLFFRLHGALIAPDELSAYCERLKSIGAAGGQVKEVHAYTIARPTPEPFASRLLRDELEALAATIRESTQLKVRVFD
jgi:wyosine [tRNA(Phe)-imidazoG37] synthetase (radical SAM superfamily)